MLLRNESCIKHIIEIKLVFDDNTTKEFEICEGQFVRITHRKNGFLECALGVIKKIKPVIKKTCIGVRESAVIVLDMSSVNNAYVEHIELEDVVDIDLPECQYPNCGNIPCEFPDSCPYLKGDVNNE